MPLTTRYGFADTPTPGNPLTAWTTVSVQANAGTGTITVNSAASFPSSVEFDIVVGDLQLDGTLTNAERAHVLSVSGSTFTISGTWAATHAAGESVYHELSAEGLKQNPGAMTDSGDMTYLASTGRMARLAAPADGTYATTWTAGVPTWGAPGSDKQVVYNNAGKLGGAAAVTINDTEFAGFSHIALRVSRTLAVADSDYYLGFGGTQTLAPTVDLPLGTAFGGQITLAMDAANTKDYGFLHGFTASAQPYGAAGATYSFVVGVGGYINSFGSAANVTDLYALYASYDRASDTGTWTNAYSFWATDLAITNATNPYYIWLDSRGVMRVREDSTFDSVAQAILALYNPRFTKYTPGATNHERIVLQWETDVATWRTEAGGTGTLRDIQLAGSNIRLAANTKLSAGKTLAFTGSSSGVVTVSVAAAAGTHTIKLPTADGASGEFLKTDGAGQWSFQAVSGGGLTVGTTTITSGVSGRVLYDNAGLLGEMTTTGSGTVLALATSPSFTTPALGTPSAGVLTNCTGLPAASVVAGSLGTGAYIITESVGSSGLTITGATQTSDFPNYVATQTWNNAATTFRMMKLTVTATAKANASRIFECVDGTTSCVSVEGAWGTGPALYVGGPVGVAGYMRMDVSGGGRNITSSGGGFSLNTQDTGLVSIVTSLGFVTFGTDSANHCFGIRATTNPQSLRLYNTFTSTTSYERLELDWITTANTMLIGCQKGSGGGTARVMNLVYGGTTTAAISVPITSGQVTFGGGLVAGGTITSGANFHEHTEMTAPAAGAADTVRIFAQDNGAGKTQLMAIFSSGAAQQLAIQP